MEHDATTEQEVFVMDTSFKIEAQPDRPDRTLGEWFAVFADGTRIRMTEAEIWAFGAVDGYMLEADHPHVLVWKQLAEMIAARKEATA